MPCKGAALPLQGTAWGHTMAVTTTTFIHRPLRGDHLALPVRTSTKPVSKGSTALNEQQRLPAWLSATPPPPPPIIKTMAKYFIICSNYPQIVKHWQPAARPPRREGDEVSWGECCAVSLRAPKGCKMRLGTGAGIRPHHPNPLSATQEGSKPPAPWAGAAGKTPTQIPLFPFCQAVQPRVLGSQSSLLALHMPPWGLGTSKQLFSSKAHSATWIGAFGNVQSCLILIPILHPPFSSSISILIPIFHAPPHPHPPSPPSIPMPYPKHRDKPGTPGLFVPSQPC